MLGATAALLRAVPRGVQHRHFATSPGAVKLAYDVAPPGSARGVSEKTNAVVVLHGLYGSRRNWRSIAKRAAHMLCVPVYSLDLRNHGESPHAETMTYEDMAGDVHAFIQEQRLNKVALIGHSLGGKVAMTLALNPAVPQGTLSHMISVDMSPSQGAISPGFMAYIKAMKEIERANVSKQSDAQAILSRTEPDPDVLQFLLTNLLPGAPKRFRLPLDTLQRSLEGVGAFPFAQPGADDGREVRTWDGPSLFIKGKKSKYLNRHTIALAKEYFPHMQLAEMDTGHWCQAEDPATFLDYIQRFLCGDPVS
ncbi:ribonuclease III [Malassezia vespertilionis]|uniref:AB hydrolase-1 domain-containing protein n=1 Tax=Malassezia vespertilionis TaxID=2020962 RepID=A0A2N1J7E5_9BASI|nr:ribonuclease III [Malassezia vespertilionis]PKI82483.1 hypothetical protein MVES_003695 [Malassezia vespertilionis]WFD08087.1 ribonuclease III [Malassezia vespertilionis]